MSSELSCFPETTSQNITCVVLASVREGSYWLHIAAIVWPSAAKSSFPTHCPVPTLMTSGAGSRRMSHKRIVLSELVVARKSPW